jgi:hypothetical protein
MPDTARPYRALYCSRIAPRLLPRLDAGLREIMASSMRNNAPSRISGLLVAHDGWFVQALEGPELAVQRRLDVIRADPRHTDLKIIARTEGAARAFPQWSMCALGLSRADAAILGTLSGKAFDPTRWSEASTMRLLTTVSLIHARVLAERYEAELAGHAA